MKNQTLLTIIFVFILMNSFLQKGFSQNMNPCSFPLGKPTLTHYPNQLTNVNYNMGSTPQIVAGTGNANFPVGNSKGSYFQLFFAPQSIGKNYVIGNTSAIGGSDDGSIKGTTITLFNNAGQMLAFNYNPSIGGTSVNFIPTASMNVWVLISENVSCGINNTSNNIVSIKCMNCSSIPPNDDPDMATILVPTNGVPPTVVSGSTIFSTNTIVSNWGYSGPVCSSVSCSGGLTSYPKDVWYKMNTLNYNTLTFNIVAPVQFGTVGLIRVYASSNGNNNFQMVYCQCSPSSTLPLTNITVPNLQPNTIYYVAISPKVGTSGFWSNFTIAVQGSNTNSFMLGNFSGNNVNFVNNLEWDTKEEFNVLNYEIEKSSLENGNFSIINTINSNSISSVNNYNIADYVEDNGVYFYRLGINYMDGRKEYSKTIKISKNEENKIKLYPNPTIDYLNIDFNNQFKYDFKIEIFTLQGTKVMSNQYSSIQDYTPINLSTYTPGMYIIEIKDQENVIKERFVKK
jgi:hypothetical protein